MVISMKDESGCFSLLLQGCYGLPMFLTTIWVWVAPALQMFERGQLLEAVVWIVFIGPIVGGIAGTVWPIYWLI
jgi:hypothetical protein|tara:strand:+ start:410 stop:631 length:222 start_codon:yes stop_codon:yes gene_type:complete